MRSCSELTSRKSRRVPSSPRRVLSGVRRSPGRGGTWCTGEPGTGYGRPRRGCPPARLLVRYADDGSSSVAREVDDSVAEGRAPFPDARVRPKPAAEAATSGGNAGSSERDRSCRRVRRARPCPRQRAPVAGASVGDRAKPSMVTRRPAARGDVEGAAARSTPVPTVPVTSRLDRVGHRLEPKFRASPVSGTGRPPGYRHQPPRGRLQVERGDPRVVARPGGRPPRSCRCCVAGAEREPAHLDARPEREGRR